MLRAFITTLFTITCLGLSLVTSDIENDETLTRRFILPDFLNPFVIGPALIQTLVVTSGYLTLHAFEQAFNKSCTNCKCFGVCEIGYIEAEKDICGPYWTSVNCADVSTPVPPMTTAGPSTAAPDHASTAPTMRVCSTFCSIASMAKGVVVANPNATECPVPSTHTTPEAFPMSCCSIQEPSSQWLQGPKVMKMCDSLPHYTAVGKFVHGQYVENTAAIAVECLKDGEHGLQAIHQSCNAAPSMIHISNKGPDGFRDPDNFYLLATK